MEDDQDNDFTFCQVSAPINDTEQSILPGVANISIQVQSESESTNSHTSNQIGVFNNPLSANNSAVNQEKVGSLSFNVISADAQNQSTQPPKKPSTESSAMKKPATPARSKVPFEKGYSQMDWLKLTRTHPDLAGLKGQSNKRLIPKSEVKQHVTEGSMWTILKGRVYNIYPYMKFHPGGDEILMKAVGKDCTSLFNKYHAWVNAEFLLEKCLVGMLDESSEKK